MGHSVKVLSSPRNRIMGSCSSGLTREQYVGDIYKTILKLTQFKKIFRGLNTKCLFDLFFKVRV